MTHSDLLLYSLLKLFDRCHQLRHSASVDYIIVLFCVNKRTDIFMAIDAIHKQDSQKNCIPHAKVPWQNNSSETEDEK